jgi:hypothetical protein
MRYRLPLIELMIELKIAPSDEDARGQVYRASSETRDHLLIVMLAWSRIGRMTIAVREMTNRQSGIGGSRGLFSAAANEHSYL